ncbi:hypothetical protein [Halpernia sp.]|uniref:hypothetical protein n=1 Tax=Halpernia sp. TaxID=2782209 RepID=UPI003A8F5C0B
MKNYFTKIAFGGLLLFTACTKEKTTVVEPNGDQTTVTKVGLDDQKIDSAKVKVNEGLQKTGDAIEKGANDVKEGVKDATNDAASAVENGAKKVKEKTEK